METGCEFGCQAFGPPLQVSRKRILHHSCDTAHYIDQSHADLSRRDDGFARMGAVAKRSIRNGLQTRAFDSVAYSRSNCLLRFTARPQLLVRVMVIGRGKRDVNDRSSLRTGLLALAGTPGARRWQRENSAYSGGCECGHRLRSGSSDGGKVCLAMKAYDQISSTQRTTGDPTANVRELPLVLPGSSRVSPHHGLQEAWIRPTCRAYVS